MSDTQDKDSIETEDNSCASKQETEDETDETENSSSNTQHVNDLLSTLLEPLSFTDQSDLYVVSVDGIPKFYVKDEKSASDKMWDISRKLAGTHYFAGYRTNFLKIKDNELHIIGSYRLFVIAYDIILHRIKYYKIEECI